MDCNLAVRLRRWWGSYVTNGGVAGPEDPAYLRVCSINVLVLFLGAACAIFALFNVLVIGFHRAAPIVGLDVAGLLCALVVGVDFRRSRDVDRAGFLANAACFAILLAFIVQAGGDDYFILWAMLYPPVAFLLCGPRRGTIHIAMFVGVLYVAAYLGMGQWNHGHLELIALSNLVGASLALATVVGVTEANREYVFRRLVNTRAELKRISIRDELTGVYNRRYFNEVLAREFSRSLRERRRLALLILDVDRFKDYNDANGHPAGDEVLQRVAGVVSEAFARAEDLAFRLGGEEFGVLFHVSRPGAAEAMAERIRRRVESLGIPAAAGEFDHVTVSVGVGYAGGTPAETPGSLYALVDSALYRAKRAGRNRVVAATSADGDGAPTERIDVVDQKG